MKTNINQILTHPSVIAAAALMAFTLPLRAQTAPPPSAASHDQIIKLEDFVVKSTASSGYRATNSLSATGIGTPISETPSTIEVVTQGLIKDNRLDLINDALRYTPGVTPSPSESLPFVRGFMGVYTLRNGVFRRQNLTTWNVDNVEVIQGPSSIFYSNIRPGGVINYNTIKPVFGRDFSDLDVSGGNYDYYRAEFAVNAGNDRLSVRADVGAKATNSFQHSYHETQKFLSFAISWKPTPDQLLTLEGATESVSRLNAWLSPLTNSRYWMNPAAIASGQSVGTWMHANYPGLPVYDEYAPFEPDPSDPFDRLTPFAKTYQSGVDKPVDLSYVAKITDNLVFNAIVNYTFENNEGINVLAPDPLADGSFPNLGFERFVNVRDSYNANLRLTYRLNVRGVQNTLMVGDDNQWVTQRFPQVAQLNYPSNPANPITVGAANMRSTPLSYNYFPDVMPELDGYVAMAAAAPYNSVRDTLQYYGGEYLVDQIAALHKSLFLVIGDRYTPFRQHVWWPFRPDLEAHTTPDAIYRKWTPQYGALYKIPGTGISAYYTHAEAVVPQTQIDASGKTVNPITSTGWDAGVKLDLLKQMLTGTVDYYSINETNTAISDSAQNVAHGLPSNATYGYYTYGNAQRVRGLQADINYNITQDLQLVFGYNHFFEADYIAPNSNPLLIGLPIAALPPTNWFVWSRYNITSGALKGLFLGGGARYNDRATIAWGGSFDTKTIHTAAYTIYDGLVGYNFHPYGHTLEMALNVKNLTNFTGREIFGVWAVPRTVILSARVHF